MSVFRVSPVGAPLTPELVRRVDPNLEPPPDHILDEINARLSPAERGFVHVEDEDGNVNGNELRFYVKLAIAEAEAAEADASALKLYAEFCLEQKRAWDALFPDAKFAMTRVLASCGALSLLRRINKKYDVPLKVVNELERLRPRRARALDPPYASIKEILQLQITDDVHLRVPIFPMLVDLTSLQKLEIYRLTTLPAELGGLPSLRELTMLNNSLSSYPDTFFRGLLNLHVLHIYDHDSLVSLPDSLGELSSLRSLLIQSNNSLTSLPNSLGKRSNLLKLKIKYNQSLVSLPDSLGELSNLHDLEIAPSQLTSLPNTLGELSNLHTLEISSNMLTSLPDTLGKLSNLHTLKITYSRELASLPDTLGELSNLHELEIDSTGLMSLPVTLGKLSNLKILHIYWNSALTSLPAELGKLSNLYSLGITYNGSLSSLPAELGKLSNLRHLEIKHNHSLLELPTELLGLKKFDWRYVNRASINPWFDLKAREYIN